MGVNRFLHVVYKVTFPNGKIYVGKDIGKGGHSIRYFGSWNAALVEQDFTKDELANFIVRKEILFESSDPSEVGKREIELILELEANNPCKGYNRVPKYQTELSERSNDT
ncbi:hypothetical protein DL239_04610 [Sedimentitalea sp. CY04]|uniref:GIY-YIG nuclease family protein n=2 Tax=Parasedimentitalea denitrificans TaxID=2211118 RepID=A0ABX0W5N7_9RHOB|nr:hypothetical protein [Sedimentitalea sp. CY04]